MGNLLCVFIMEIKRFNITRTEGGRFSEQSRAVMREQFLQLMPGDYTITIEPARNGKYTPTRYKYYFAAVMAAILEKCQDRFLITDHFTGEQHPPRTTTDIHEIMKLWYNPVTVITPKGEFTSGNTTTSLSDRDFIGTYLESILAEFSMPPYGVDFIDYEEWKQQMKNKTR